MDQLWLIELFKALANEKRLRIIQYCQKPRRVSEIIEHLQISRNKTTDYISRLHQLGLVSKLRNADKTVTITALICISSKGVILYK